MATFAATKMLGGRVDAHAGSFTAGIEGYRRYWNAVNTMRMGNHYMDQASLPDVLMTVGGAYAQYGRALSPRLRLQAAGRVDAAASEARSTALNTDLYWAYKGNRSREARDANPSGSLSLSWSPAGWAELFAGAARTARLPDPQERYFALRRSGFDWVGNPELRPTRNSEADLGANLRLRRFTLRPTLFYSRLTDFVAVHNQPVVYRMPSVMNAAARSYTNIPARIYGGEVSYTVPINRALLVLGGVSYVRGTKAADPERRVFSRDIAEMPPLKSRTALRLGTRVLFAEIEGIAAGAQRHVDADMRESRTPGYAILNVKGGVHARRVSFAAGVDNVFDRFYYEHFSYQRDPFRLGTRVPEPGMNLYVTISYAF
jgi:iron complex outermembrane receptor protein